MDGDRSVEAVWHGGYHTTVAAGSFTIEVDEPESVGGTNLGPQPTDLFLASIASCFTLALSYAARKRSIELTELSVRAIGTYDGLQFGAVEVEARIGAPEAELQRLVETAERVCYVTNTLRSGLKLTTRAVSATAVPTDGSEIP
ncbi:OsmC family protein [Kribbella sp. NPDC051952]|uniref:OsmC family protein n=1 Tax=Kribbella sp. NPDC051952 TaxID=3154851 RepID=UPI00343D28D9